MILKLTNRSKNFYAYLGIVFGSREAEKVTGDRFYDDDDKDWYIYFHNNKPTAFVSVQQSKIKNVWGDNREHLIKTLQEVNKKESIKESVVPIVFKKEYEAAGFLETGNGYKNFMKIRGVKNGED